MRNGRASLSDRSDPIHRVFAGQPPEGGHFEQERINRGLGICVLFAASLLSVSVTLADENSPRGSVSAWGTDHVGESFPEYMTGDECLFCHRDIGTTWQENRHQLTLRLPPPNDDALNLLAKQRGQQFVNDVNLLIGSDRVTRFMKRSQEYGKLEILSCWVRFTNDGVGTLAEDVAAQPHWDATVFGDRCAGCHSTAVDTTSRAFSAVSLDCFTCHGDVQTDHTTETSHALLSAGKAEARQVVSICGQCHLRGGKSKTSGLPYANTFVAGDNLFRDFQVEFSPESIRSQPAIEQHIFLNSRDVALLGELKTDCLTCHDVHGQSTDKHRELENSALCATCHVAGSDNGRIHDTILPARRLKEQSRVCDY